eukprot:180190-Amphidinium_carterae.1
MSETKLNWSKDNVEAVRSASSKQSPDRVLFLLFTAYVSSSLCVCTHTLIVDNVEQHGRDEGMIDHVLQQPRTEGNKKKDAVATTETQSAAVIWPQRTRAGA